MKSVCMILKNSVWNSTNPIQKYFINPKGKIINSSTIHIQTISTLFYEKDKLRIESHGIQDHITNNRYVLNGEEVKIRR